MGTFHVFEPGETFESPVRPLGAELLKELIELGGYTHPLFVDPDFAAESPLGGTPFPGEALLLIMGGLAEQTDRFDETTVALVAFDEVAFKAPALAGDEVRLSANVLDKQISSSGARGIVVFGWQLTNQRDELLVSAKARMLFRLD